MEYYLSYYHKKNKDHILAKTPSPTSKNWKNRTIAFYAFSDETKGSIPIYRFYHGKNKDHFYSKNLTAKGNAKDQGVEFGGGRLQTTTGFGLQRGDDGIFRRVRIGN